jgi:hypothetical protein
MNSHLIGALQSAQSKAANESRTTLDTWEQRRRGLNTASSDRTRGFPEFCLARTHAGLLSVRAIVHAVGGLSPTRGSSSLAAAIQLGYHTAVSSAEGSLQAPAGLSHYRASRPPADRSMGEDGGERKGTVGSGGGYPKASEPCLSTGLVCRVPHFGAQGAGALSMDEVIPSKTECIPKSSLNGGVVIGA